MYVVNREIKRAVLALSLCSLIPSVVAILVALVNSVNCYASAPIGPRH